MYSTPPVMTGYLASTGTAALLGQIWLAVALLVVGGTLLTVARFFPRVAVEPVRGRHDADHHLRFTINGRARS